MLRSDPKRRPSIRNRSARNQQVPGFLLTRVPSEYNLHNIYPNPFNSTVQIRYSVPLISRVSLKVYDVTGSLIEEIVSDVRSAGLHSVTWNALNVASGIYFVRMEAAEFSQTTKVMLIK